MRSFNAYSCKRNYAFCEHLRDNLNPSKKYTDDTKLQCEDDLRFNGVEITIPRHRTGFESTEKYIDYLCEISSKLIQNAVCTLNNRPGSSTRLALLKKPNHTLAIYPSASLMQELLKACNQRQEVRKVLFGLLSQLDQKRYDQFCTLLKEIARRSISIRNKNYRKEVGPQALRFKNTEGLSVESLDFSKIDLFNLHYTPEVQFASKTSSKPHDTQSAQYASFGLLFESTSILLRTIILTDFSSLLAYVIALQVISVLCLFFCSFYSNRNPTKVSLPTLKHSLELVRHE